MKNFRRVEAVFVAPSMPLLKEELRRNDSLWMVDQSRQQRISVQRHTQSIFLRGLVRNPGSTQSSNDIQESALTRFAPSFPATLEFLKRVAEHEDGELCRALYVRLSPHSVVYPHVDKGSYYACRDRYHLVMDSPGGSYMKCEGEEVVMQAGELWWFNNKIVHESANPSDEWRVHLIFDLFPKTPVSMKSNDKNPLNYAERIKNWARRFERKACQRNPERGLVVVGGEIPVLGHSYR